MWPIKDADGLELFKLQVWWFLCISCNDDDDWDEDEDEDEDVQEERA